MTIELHRTVTGHFIGVQLAPVLIARYIRLLSPGSYPRLPALRLNARKVLIDSLL